MRKRRRQKSQRDMNTGVLEIINAARGQNLKGDLRERGYVWRLGAHESKSFAVDTNQTDQRVFAMGPVPGVGVGQMIRFGPDAQVGIKRHQRHRRRAKRRIPGLRAAGCICQE